MKFSSTFKVGLLTIVAIFILIMSVLWIKGRALSTGERITVKFHDANGIRSGASVQMMGLRIGQIEDVIPHIDDKNSYVSIKFVITEPNIKILDASEISIQTSGVIGEQFLEVTPPRTRYIYVPLTDKTKVLNINDNVKMLLSDELHKIGHVRSLDIVDTKSLPFEIQNKIKSAYSYKVGYVVTLPGLILPDAISGKIQTKDGKNILNIVPKQNIKLDYPVTDSKYTVIEPRRWSDFLEIQFRAAESLAETNERVSKLLSDDVIASLKDSIENINQLTVKANTTLEKAEMLIDSSKTDIEDIISNLNKITERFVRLTDSLQKLAGDENFHKDIISTTKSVDRLAKNLNTILENPKTVTLVENLDVTSKNIAEISTYVNDITKDEKLKKDIAITVTKFNSALDELNKTLEIVNTSVGQEQRAEIKQAIDDASQTSANVRKFSEKLNKRFLLFRLMF